MKIHSLVLFLLLLLTSRLEAKQRQVSIPELATATTDSAKASIYGSLSEQYLSVDQQKAIEYAQLALQFAVASNNVNLKLKALHQVGGASLAASEFKKATDAYNSALQLSAQAGDEAGILKAYTSLGSVSFKAAAYNKALSLYKAAAGYAQQQNRIHELGNILILTGSVQEHKKNYPEALDCYLKAAAISETQHNQQEWAVRLMQAGMVHLQMAQPEKALPYMLQALQLNKTEHDTLRVKILRRIAKAYMAMYNNQAAIRYALQSYQMAEQAGAITELIASARVLQAIYADMQDYQQAYKYQAISTAQEEALQKEQEKEKLLRLTTAHAAEKEDLAELVQQVQNQNLLLEVKHTLLLHILITLAILAGLALLLLFFVYRRRLDAVKRELQDTREQLQARNFKIQLQREELEQQSVIFQQQNEQLERHNNFKSKIFSIISHDLRSPFASVKGVLNLVQNKPMSETGIKYLFGLLSKDVDVTLNMLNNLLVWSKAQLEGSEVCYSPVDVQQLADENMELAHLQASHKNIHITNRVKPGIFVLADKERTNFVLRNLIMNALKFTFEGGSVTITAKELGDTVTIAVHDDGKGISEENLVRLFTDERFTTIGTSSEKGTGLGLMLCKEFIESMEGRIGAESIEGKGSTFYFTLRKTTVPTSEPVQKLQLA